MKRSEKCKLINYAIKDYNKKFNLNYKSIYKSKKVIQSLLKEYTCSSMRFWFYCCEGLYKNCWQEPIEEGIWGMTQEEVNKMIIDIMSSKLLRKCRNENRMFYCEKDDVIELLIVARDLEKCDYFITFSKEKCDVF